MPTPTYTPLATITLGSAASSVTFGSIPNSYKDLVLVANGTQTANGNFALRFNSDSGSNYFRVVMYGDGSSTGSFTESSQTALGIAYWETGRSMVTCSIQDYSATDKHKSTLSRSGAGIYVHAFAGRWANTAAITSVTVLAPGTTIASGTTISLYGIAA